MLSPFDHAYPSDLAALVLRRWDEAVAAGWCGLARPDPAALAAVLSTCYQATLLREEGRPVTFRLALSDPDAFEPAGGPPSGFHRLVFIRRLPLDAHELRRLSPAAVFSRSLIGATLTAADPPAVWGLIHSGPQWLQSLRGGRPRHQTVPDVLMIAATGPGRLFVSIGSRTLAELKGGTVSSMELDLFESRWMQDRLAEMTGVTQAAVTGPGHSTDDRGPRIDAWFAAVLVGHVLRRMLATIRAAEHGGTVILIPRHRASALLSDGRQMRVKYAFSDEEPRRRIATLVEAMMHEMARDASRGAVIGWDSYQSSAAAQVAEIDEALFEVAQLLADLTRVDGTVVMTDSLEVLGFGVEIAGDLPEVGQVARARDLDGNDREWVRTDRVGTRHRSAYRLCQALHEALALVVSQDGGLRFIRWHVDAVTYWEQLAIGPWDV
jgi:hypothetical protein